MNLKSSLERLFELSQDGFLKADYSSENMGNRFPPAMLPPPCRLGSRLLQAQKGRLYRLKCKFLSV